VRAGKLTFLFLNQAKGATGVNQDFPIVYVVQQPKPNGKGWMPNLEPASQFGALKFIFAADDRPNLNPTQAVQICANVMKRFRPDVDFLLWPSTGDPAALYSTLIAIMTKLDQSLPFINFLYWERNLDPGTGDRKQDSGFYVPLKFNLNHHKHGKNGEQNGNR
jgi:hypothetical protein